MKRLVLIRHAKSAWDAPDLEDHDRPLAPRGKHDAKAMGAKLAERDFVPGLIVSSPARRARKTAKHLLRALERSDLVIDERLYLASTETILDVVRGFDDTCNSAAIIGHNPGFTEVCELLSNAGIENVPTMGIAHLDMKVDRWSDAAPGCATLVEFDYPKKTAT